MHARVLLLVCLLAASCIDPVHSDAVDALGPEANGERSGPRHRAGQPCFTCHGGSGPGPDFAVAGTVYAVRGGSDPLPGAVVAITDAAGSTQRLATNEVGNFYLRASLWTPAFPLHVQLEYGDAKKEMTTRIGRDGGCASCHIGAGSAKSMPAVFLRDQ